MPKIRDTSSVKSRIIDDQKQETGKRSTATLTSTFVLLAVLLASFVALIMKMSESGCPRRPYNTTLLEEPILLDDGSLVYKIAVVTDLDHASKHPTQKSAWQSYMKRGFITISKDRATASVSWKDGKEVSLTSSIAAGGRAMELSDLAVFDGHLVTVDDRTGILYRIRGDQAYPWVFLIDGPGDVGKGFKGEWLTVKDGDLWVGGLGKEWTTTEGVFSNYNPMWVKRVTPDGCVTHVNWIENYKKLRAAAGINYPGYMIHESGQWSSIHKKWFFMPRRASNETYTEAADETRGTNYLLIASEDFSRVEVKTIGKRVGSRGFSAFQFVPGTNDRIIVALKSEEKDGVPVASYITIFDYEKNVLLDEEQLQGAYKYEGIAFA